MKIDNNLWSTMNLSLSYRYKSPASCVFVSDGCDVVESIFSSSPKKDNNIKLDMFLKEKSCQHT